MYTARLTLIAIVLALAATPTALAQSNAKEIMAKKPAELIEILKNPQATTFEKAKACQRLAVVGTKDAVPALAALLPDEHLNCYARCALEAIPGPEADEALRQAATKLHGRQLVGVIDSIGQRRDVKAIELLAKLLKEKDDSVASAAAGALGRIGTPEATRVLIETMVPGKAVPLVVADACLACAQRLASLGQELRAMWPCVVIADETEHLPLPPYIVCSACSWIARLGTGTDGAKTIVSALLRLSGKVPFDAVLEIAREVPGAGMTAALVGELDKLPSERRALLLRAIGDRKDAPPLDVIVKASKSDSPAVREAAIYVLTKHGDASSVAILLDAALAGGDMAAVAKDGLQTLPGKEVDDAIAAKLATADAKAKPILLELVGARQIVSAMPAVREAMEDADQKVRLAALAAMAQLIEVKDLELLINEALYKGGEAAEIAAARAALATAVQRMGDRDACAARLAQDLNADSAPTRAYLLELLGKVSGKTALAAVVAAAKSPDPATKDAATRVLGEWMNTDAAPALLKIAKTDPDQKYQVRALRGYIRIARQQEIPWWEKSNAGETKLAMFRAAMEVAKRPEEKKLALDILTRIPSPTTLSLAVSHLDDAAIKQAAAEAAVKIAGHLIGSEPKAVAEAMQKVVASDVEGQAADRAKQLLDRAKAGIKK